MLRSVLRLSAYRHLAPIIPAPPASHVSHALTPSESYGKYLSLSAELALKRRKKDIEADRERYERAFKQASAPQSSSSSSSSPAKLPPKRDKSAPKYLVEDIVRTTNAQKGKSSSSKSSSTTTTTTSSSSSSKTSQSPSPVPSLSDVVLDVHKAGVSPNFEYDSSSSTSSSSSSSSSSSALPLSLGVEDPRPYLLASALGSHPAALTSLSYSYLIPALDDDVSSSSSSSPSSPSARDIRLGLELLLAAAEGGDQDANLSMSEVLSAPLHPVVSLILQDRNDAQNDAVSDGAVVVVKQHQHQQLPLLKALQSSVLSSESVDGALSLLSSSYLTRASDLGSSEASYRLGSSMLSRLVESLDSATGTSPDLAAAELEASGLKLLLRAAGGGNHGPSADYLLFYRKNYTSYYDDEDADERKGSSSSSSSSSNSVGGLPPSSSSSSSSFLPLVVPPPLPSVAGTSSPPPVLSRYGHDLLSTFLNYRTVMSALLLAEYYTSSSSSSSSSSDGSTTNDGPPSTVATARRKDGICRDLEGETSHDKLAVRTFLCAATFARRLRQDKEGGKSRRDLTYGKDDSDDDEGGGMAAVNAGVLLYNGEEGLVLPAASSSGGASASACGTDEKKEGKKKKKKGCGHEHSHDGHEHSHDEDDAAAADDDDDKSYEQVLAEEEDIAGKLLLTLGGVASPSEWHEFAASGTGAEAGAGAGDKSHRLREQRERVVGRDRHAAFLLYQLAGEMGEVEGWRNVAACYFLGEGVQKCDKSGRYILDVMVKPVDERRRREREMEERDDEDDDDDRKLSR